MEKLLEQLEYNYIAEKQLEERYYNTLTGTFWNSWMGKDKQVDELLWISQIQKRVLRLRYRILENIQLDVSKKMQEVSTAQRKLNLKQVA